MNNTTSIPDFSPYLLSIHASLVLGPDGQVMLNPSASAPSWLRPMLEFVHERTAPDPFVLDCVYLIATHFAAASDLHDERAGASAADGAEEDDSLRYPSVREVDFTEVGATASEDFAQSNCRSPSLMARWLVWKAGAAHWGFLDAALRHETPTDFAEAVEWAMRLQCEHVAERVDQFYEEVLSEPDFARHLGPASG